MQYGVVFPQTEIGADAGIVRNFAQAAEDLGFDYLVAFDHVAGADPERAGPWQGGPYDYRSSFHEPFVLFSYLAGITDRLTFATGILILPQRQTVLVAKQAAGVDILSGGRLRLGVGVGWNPFEYEALGVDFHRRGSREAEQVTLLRKLWTQPLVDFDGRFDRVAGGGINPLPVQRPIPVWFGGGSEATLRRAAKLGDGWMPNSPPSDQLADQLATLRRYLSEAGRDPASFGIDARIDLHRIPEEAWPEALARLRSLDVTHICVNTMRMGYSVEEHINAIARFRDAVRA